MARPLIPDELWSLIEPHLPPERPVPYGRKPVPNRKALTGIVFVLKTGIQWEHLPQEMGCGSGMTCWRRLRDWQQAGVWDRILHILQRSERWVRWGQERSAADSAATSPSRRW